MCCFFVCWFYGHHQPKTLVTNLVHSDLSVPPRTDEMLDPSDCTLSLDSLFFVKPIVHKV